MNKLIVLGIDPGYRTGYCVWTGEKIIEISTCKKDKFADILRQFKQDGIVTAVGIEVSTRSHIYSRGNLSQPAMLRIARNIGENKAEAMRLVGLAEGLGFNVVQVEPKNTKLDPELFKKITGYRKRTSSHARDAWVIAKRVYADMYFQSRIEEN